MTHTRSRTGSPTPQYTTSHGLKCERLLRDTLRRADAAVARSSSLSRSRSSTPAPPTSPSYLAPHHSLIADCCSMSDDSDSDDDDRLQMPVTPLRRSRTTTGARRATPTPASIPRSHSLRPHSPSPSNSTTSRRSSASHGRAHSIALSTPVGLVHPTPQRPGPPTAARSDPTPTAAASIASAHEAVLRQRLQGVLDSNARPVHATSTGAQKAPRSVTGPNFSLGLHKELNSHARSRSASVRADGDNGWWESSSPASPTAELSSRSVSRSRHTSSRESLSGAASISASASASSSPSTPPSPSPGFAKLDLSRSPQLHLRYLPTDMPATPPANASSPQTPERPKFDVRTASQLCRTAPGLVSFRDVEGLGAPSHFYDADDDDEDQHKGWLASAWGWSPFKRSPGGKATPEEIASLKSSSAATPPRTGSSEATPTKPAVLTGGSF